MMSRSRVWSYAALLALLTVVAGAKANGPRPYEASLPETKISETEPLDGLLSAAERARLLQTRPKASPIAAPKKIGLRLVKRPHAAKRRAR